MMNIMAKMIEAAIQIGDVPRASVISEEGSFEAGALLMLTMVGILG